MNALIRKLGTKGMSPNRDFPRTCSGDQENVVMNTANLKPMSLRKLPDLLLPAVTALALWMSGVLPAAAQVTEENCTATVLNRTAQLGPGGSIAIPNVPYQLGYFRVRVTCLSNGVTIVGQSGYFTLNNNGSTSIGPITYGQISPLPIS